MVYFTFQGHLEVENKMAANNNLKKLYIFVQVEYIKFIEIVTLVFQVI